MFNFDKTIIELIILDLFVLGFITLCAFNGLRRGAIRTFFSLLWFYISFIITMLLYERVAVFFQAVDGKPSYIARIICFSIIFVLFSAVSKVFNILIIRLLTILISEGMSSRVIGAILGIIEGIFLASIVMMNISFYPKELNIKNTVSYKMTKNIAQDVNNFTFRYMLSNKWFVKPRTD
ncbi:MAG: CvpA family protein [bacterium]